MIKEELALNKMYLLVRNPPKVPTLLNSSKLELNRSAVDVAMMQQKKICQERVLLQNEETSSIQNSNPPTGAPKAADTPAATPADMKLRLKIE